MSEAIPEGQTPTLLELRENFDSLHLEAGEKTGRILADRLTTPVSPDPKEPSRLKEYPACIDGAGEFWRDFSSPFLGAIEDYFGPEVANPLPPISPRPEEAGRLFEGLSLDNPEGKINAGELLEALLTNLIKTPGLGSEVIAAISERMQKMDPRLNEEEAIEKATTLWLSFIAGIAGGTAQELTTGIRARNNDRKLENLEEIYRNNESSLTPDDRTRYKEIKTRFEEAQQQRESLAKRLQERFYFQRGNDTAEQTSE